MCAEGMQVYMTYIQKNTQYVIMILTGSGMRVLVVGEISSNRKLAAVETWTDPVKEHESAELKWEKNWNQNRHFKVAP